MSDLEIKKPPKGLAVFALVGPSIIWCAEYIGSGEVILATRTGAILGTGVLWAVVVGIFLKYWIGLSGARYTVCTGEGMIDMFERIPGPRHWAVWIVLVAQFVAGTLSMGAIAAAAGAFINSLVPINPYFCGWFVAFFALVVVWSGFFDILKIVMSIFILITVLGVLYVAIHVFPGATALMQDLSFRVPEVPQWAVAEGIGANPWKEILPLIGWGAGGFASQVWYTYWVLGAGYGAAAGRGYGKPADVSMLKKMSRDSAEKIKGWCRVLYVDATLALVIGVVVTGSFLIAGAGILGVNQIAPQGQEIAKTISTIFSLKWGAFGAFAFKLAGAAALTSTLIGLFAGWPRLLADSFRICIPGFAKIPWKIQFRSFLIFFLFTNMIIVFHFGMRPVFLVQLSAILDGLLLTPLQAIWVAVGLFVVMPKILSKEASAILKPNWVFAVGLLIAFLVFSYFCVFQIPSVF